MTTATTHRLFVQCAIGLEELLREELSSFAISGRVTPGGVECRGDEEALARVCLLSRLAESVRVRLKEFEAKDFDSLVKQLKALPFRAYLPAGAQVQVRVVCHQSRLWHSGAVEERVAAVLREHVGWVISREARVTQVVHVRLDDDKVQVSLDASGERLSRRGYRQHVEAASLRETLAAALVRVAASSLFEGEAPVIWDPFCGAGTVLLEALEMAHGKVAGASRTFAFQRWRGRAEGALDELRSRLGDECATTSPAATLRVIGSDRKSRALQAASENAKAARLDSFCTFVPGDIEAVLPQIPSGARVVTNPPYGKRVQEAGAMRKLLGVLEKRPDLAPIVVLVGGGAREIVPKDRPALFRTKNGGIPVSARLLRA